MTARIVAPDPAAERHWPRLLATLLRDYAGALTEGRVRHLAQLRTVGGVLGERAAICLRHAPRHAHLLDPLRQLGAALQLRAEMPEEAAIAELARTLADTADELDPPNGPAPLDPAPARAA
jgi:hypothetical protein